MMFESHPQKDSNQNYLHVDEEEPHGKRAFALQRAQVSSAAKFDRVKKKRERERRKKMRKRCQ